MPLDQIYMTSNSLNNNEFKDEKQIREEKYIVQMEVNITKINKNSASIKQNINQSYNDKEELLKCIVPNNSKENKDNLIISTLQDENLKNKVFKT